MFNSLLKNAEISWTIQWNKERGVDDISVQYAQHRE